MTKAEKRRRKQIWLRELNPAPEINPMWAPVMLAIGVFYGAIGLLYLIGKLVIRMLP